MNLPLKYTNHIYIFSIEIEAYYWTSFGKGDMSLVYFSGYIKLPEIKVLHL